MRYVNTFFTGSRLIIFVLLCRATVVQNLTAKLGDLICKDMLGFFAVSRRSQYAFRGKTVFRA